LTTRLIYTKGSCIRVVNQTGNIRWDKGLGGWATVSTKTAANKGREKTAKTNAR